MSPPEASPPEKDKQGEAHVVDEVTEFQASWRVWCIFIVLCLLSFMGAIESTVTTTALPTITREIGGSDEYVWIANSYLFTSTVPQPPYAQISNIFGRRNPMLFAIALFALGSGLAGGATSAEMLIAARTIQGLGTGGLYVLSDIIICDIIPPRYRGPYLSAVLSTAAIGTTVGPIIGGALAQVNWRWVFELTHYWSITRATGNKTMPLCVGIAWINLPISGVGLIAMVLFLNVGYKRSPTWNHALARVDFLGNALFIPSLVAVFFGLIMGGTRGYPLEASPICREPSMPPRLFRNRTSCAGYLIIFLGAVVLQAINFFLPVYFQGIKGASPLLSGVYFLPFALAIIPFGGIAGALLSRTGLYKPLHWAGFVLSAVGVGLLSTLSQHSSTGDWVGFQILASGGSGLVFTATLPSTLAALHESDVAVATGTYSFVRSFGLVWGVTVASIAFNGQVNAHSHIVSDAAVRSLLLDGGAYTYASEGSSRIAALSEPTKGQVFDVYSKALRVVWLVCVALSCLGFLITFIEKHLELRRSNETEFGLAKDDSTKTRIEEGNQSST